MGLSVKVFTAGSHFAGLQEPGDTEELVEMLLNRSGYTKEYQWECRIDKVKHCSAESRPIRVVGYKTYGVALRVKPSAFATVDYQMTLCIPEGSGYSAKNLFEQLRANEKSISRVARQQKRDDKVNEQPEVDIPPAPQPFRMETVVPETKPTPNPESNGKEVVVEEYRPEFVNLRGILKDFGKLKYVLEKIRKVIGFNFCRTKLQFSEAFRHECKWDKEGHHKGAVGRVLTELVKEDYIMEVVNDHDMIIGYTITEKGNSFLDKHKDDKPIPHSPGKRKEEPKVDIPVLLTEMRDKLQELADVASKIAANNTQKDEHYRKIDELNKENDELSKILEQNRESHDLLNRLGQLITPLPLQGTH